MAVIDRNGDKAVAERGRAVDAAILAIGTAEYPDRATTVLLQLPALGEVASLRLTGPGIPSEAALDEADLPREVVAMLMRNAELYPLGLDVILTAPGVMVGLPRSTRIDRKEPH